MMNLKEQYQHPLWQRKKNKIYQRDGWTCQICKNDCFELTSQLQCHHLYRVKDFHVWEYDDDSLVTLCSNCHELADSPEMKKIAGLLVFKMLTREIDPIELSELIELKSKSKRKKSQINGKAIH